MRNWRVVSGRGAAIFCPGAWDAMGRCDFRLTAARVASSCTVMWDRGRRTSIAILSLALMLPGCGGGGDAPSGFAGVPPTTPTPSPSPGTGQCSLRARQDWAFAQMREWYLFPETLPASLDPAPYATLLDYVDALTAEARAQGKDRYFTYVTSIAEEDAYYDSGESAGFGVRLQYDEAAGRVFVAEAFEGTAALAAGLDRGAEILAIGETTASLRDVSDIMASEGSIGVSDALGPSTAGTTRALRIRDTAGERVITMTKTDYDLTPVSSRYGARVIEEGGRRIAYVNLRTFIDPADPALRSAFAGFRAQGIDEVIVDLRYNGGGLVSIARVLGNLLGGNRSTSDIFARLRHRPEKSGEDETHRFAPQSQSVSPRRIAFIATGDTASASEMVINAMLPYLHADVALIGDNSYGKPVGQIALDQPACDDRLRLIAFSVENGAGQGSYFEGLAPYMDATCRADDDIDHPLGDPQEASIRQAIDWLGGATCTPIPTMTNQSTLRIEAAPQKPRLLMPAAPTTPQREVPGSF